MRSFSEGTVFAEEATTRSGWLVKADIEEYHLRDRVMDTVGKVQSWYDKNPSRWRLLEDVDIQRPVILLYDDGIRRIFHEVGLVNRLNYYWLAYVDKRETRPLHMVFVSHPSFSPNPDFTLSNEALAPAAERVSRTYDAIVARDVQDDIESLVSDEELEIMAHDATGPRGAWRSAGKLLRTAVFQANDVISQPDFEAYAKRRVRNYTHVVTYLSGGRNIQIFVDTDGNLWSAHLPSVNALVGRLHRIEIMPRTTGDDAVTFNIVADFSE